LTPIAGLVRANAALEPAKPIEAIATALTPGEEADMTAEATERAALRRHWERATNWPLMVAAVIFLAAYALPVLDHRR
jgi:hypothetical protein